MRQTVMSRPQEIYLRDLEMINGIRFTPREIDIAAFLQNGKTTKTIAFFLGISAKTVENVKSNLMQKLGSSSREGIIDFIEKAGKFSLLKEYYQSLLVYIAFEQKLREVSKLLDQNANGFPECM